MDALKYFWNSEEGANFGKMVRPSTGATGIPVMYSELPEEEQGARRFCAQWSCGREHLL